MNLSELTAFLSKFDCRPKKSLSQNFLIKPSLVEKTLDLANIREGDQVLEIGPGPGALTKALLKRGAKVYAVEMDSCFAKELSRFQNGNLQVFEADFLKFPLSNLPTNCKVVANLPYHITTPILEKLFTRPFESITIMVQKEIADRMKALKGSEFGSLSVFVQFHTHYEGSFLVPPSSFYPKPKVDSTVICLKPQEKPDVNEKAFFTLVHKAFQKRRKMLTSSLNLNKEALKKALLEINERADARPEMLTFNRWIELFKKIDNLLLDCEK